MEHWQFRNRILAGGGKKAESHSHLLLLRVKIIILCSNDLSPHSGQGAPNTGLGILGKRRKESTMLGLSFTGKLPDILIILILQELHGNPHAPTQPWFPLPKSFCQDPNIPKHQVRWFESSCITCSQEHAEHGARGKCHPCSDGEIWLWEDKQRRGTRIQESSQG